MEKQFLKINGYPYEFRPLVEAARVAKFISRLKRVQHSGCWEWQGAKDSYVHRYGVTSLHSRSIAAHRLAYMLFVDDIPKGYEIHHHCRNPLCCNPGHLEACDPVKHKQLDAKARHKQFCVNGHEMTEENTLHGTRGDSHICRACKSDWAAKYRGTPEDEVKAFRESGQDSLVKARRVKATNAQARTHCRRGHEFTEENTRWYQGRRYCKACHAENTLKYYHAKRSAASI